MKKLPHRLVIFFMLCLLVSTAVLAQSAENKQSTVNRQTKSLPAEQISSQPSPSHLSTEVDPEPVAEGVTVLAELPVSPQGSSQIQLSSLPLSDSIATDSVGINQPVTVKPSTDKSSSKQSSNTEVKWPDDESLFRLRQLFLQAEDYLKKTDDDNFLRLSAQLKDYPLYPYLRYQWLKKHLRSDHQVKQFLRVYTSSRYAGILKRKWLYHLAKHKRWQTFLQYYVPTGKTALSCYYHLAKFKISNSGSAERRSALKAAAKLWAVGYSQPDECDPLFDRLKNSPLFNQALLWKRFNAALNNNKTRLAIYVKKQMASAYQPTANLWLKLHRHPGRYISILLQHPQREQASPMFSYAIKRLAMNDIKQAISLWDANKQVFHINKKHQQKIEKRLAFAMAYQGDPDAYARFVSLTESDQSSRAWRVRIALSQQDWVRVISAIQAMSNEQRMDESWQYWLARAYLETGKVEAAQKLFSMLAKKRSFYGYLAADRINSMYQLVDRPLVVSQKQMNQLQHQPDFQIVYEFKVLNLERQARLQWWFALRKLDKKAIMVAAKLAQQWHWGDMPILTIAKVKYWDDIEMRFPLTYSAKIHENAKREKLNPALLFGLIRRESVFNEQAHSPVGARGLMQLMPATGRKIARHFRDPWRGSKSLYDPVKNLKYGAYYYQKLLKQFDGHYAMALAAYNAGPKRVKHWLPDEILPADIWIETIPFKETREYVIAVLTYTLIYQQRTHSDELSMRDLTQDVAPSLNAH